MKIALVSEHASPLATIGGTDAGGQNVHVRELALALGRLGNDVTVYTRRENRATQTRVALAPGVTVSHVDAGPPRTLAKDALYPLMPAFGARLEAEWTHDPPDIAHAHFWMSAIATLAAAKPLAVPVIATFHALGIDKRAQQGSCDTSPPQRLAEEKRIAREVDRVVATSSAEVFTLMRMGASAQRLSIVPCGVDLDRFSPEGPRFERSGDVLRIVSLGRLVPRKGVDDAIAALALVPNAELVIAGGSAPGCGDTDDDERRLRALARRCGVEERVDFHGPVERDDVPPLLRSGQYQSYYANPALDVLLDEGRATLDVDRRRDIYGRAAAIIKDDAPHLPLLQPPLIYGVDAKLRWSPRTDSMIDLRGASYG